VNYLLDTHTFLWWIDDDTHLSEAAREIIANPDIQHQVFLLTVKVGCSL
jgi:PIN domain nuclease of toxin-antitoxin system